MTIINRDSFLANIASNLNRPVNTEKVIKPAWDYNPQKEVFKDFTIEELVDVFIVQCENILTGFKRTKCADLNGKLSKVLLEHNAHSIVTPDDTRHDTFNVKALFDQLAKEGSNIHYWDPTLGKENQSLAEQADVGITYSDITLAESATVCQFNDKNNSRTISLLPNSYIAIIPKSTLVPRLTQAMQVIHENVEKGEQVPSCISFISGPSNSGDIEMNLVVGVHGPVKATYILVDDM